MKTKSIFSFLLAAFAFAIAVILPNELAAMVTDPHVHDFLHHGPVLGMAGTISLANLAGSSEGTPNPGGMRSLLICLARDFSAVWPKQADIVAGEVATGPTLKTGCKFAKYDFPDSTFDMNDDGSGDPGFQSFKHTTEFMIAGMGKPIQSEILKHLNSGSVIVGEMNDGQFMVAGSSDNPLYIKASGKSGKKGSDKRGYTMKGEQDGMMWPLTPLSTTVVTALPLVPVV